eukprot:363363-Chlamydomonas_euryale.AAC.6
MGPYPICAALDCLSLRSCNDDDWHCNESHESMVGGVGDWLAFSKERGRGGCAPALGMTYVAPTEGRGRGEGCLKCVAPSECYG